MTCCCGTKFEPTNPRKLYCTKACANKQWRLRYKTRTGISYDTQWGRRLRAEERGEA